MLSAFSKTNHQLNNKQMNPIIKNLLHVVRRFKLATVLNILGLSVAFAAFMVIMMQLNFDFGFDRFHRNHHHIFRLESTINADNFAVTSRPIAEDFFRSSPHIVAGTVMRNLGTDYFHVQGESEQRRFSERVVSASDGLLDVFTFDIVEGSKDAFGTSSYILIPQSLARRMFGNESAIGRQLVSTVIQPLEAGTLPTIGAVFRDFPANSILNNSIYVPMPDDFAMESWGVFSINAFVRVDDISNMELLYENFMRSEVFPAAAVAAGIGVRTTPLSAIRFTTDVSHDTVPKASRQMLMILFAIGIVIIIIAGINFTNFSTALMPMRVRNINTQRVLGAQQSTIRLMLVLEAVIFSVVSYFVAILLVKLFSGSSLADLVEADLSFSANGLVVGGMVLVAVVVGTVAGLYPSRYITSFAPALALKGNFGLSPKGKRLRNTLIGIQFVASFALIIVASFLYLQNRFMQNAPLGFNRDALIVVDIARIGENRDAFLSQIRAHSGVESITYSQLLISSSDYYSGMGFEHEGEIIRFSVIPVHYTFLQIMGIEVSEGRDFRPEDMGAGNGVVILNETAQRRHNLEVNTTINNIEIIGFVPDIKLTSFRRAAEPMAFLVFGYEAFLGHGTNALPHTYIRARRGADMRAIMTHINTTLTEFEPNHTFEVRLFDEVLQQLYEDEITLSRLITLFSLIAIFISIVGVFGLVVFDSECRRKEIGIRKVMGASTMEIIAMFNKAYIKILLICFVIAVPVAWYAVGRWLENFAYRTPMYWWVYLLAFVAIAVVTGLTVTVQNWRVASDDPVRSIKTE